MPQLVFFLEERSAEEMLRGVLPRLLPEDVHPRYIVFEGKQDLEKQISRKLKGWQAPDTLFVVNYPRLKSWACPSIFLTV